LPSPAGIEAGAEIVTAGARPIGCHHSGCRLDRKRSDETSRPGRCGIARLTLYLILAVAAAGVWAYQSLGAGGRSTVHDQADGRASGLAGCFGRADGEGRWLTGWNGSWRRFRRWITLKANVQPGHAISDGLAARRHTRRRMFPTPGIRCARRSGDIAPTLPQGVQGPYFNDEFGDVFRDYLCFYRGRIYFAGTAPCRGGCARRPAAGAGRRQDRPGRRPGRNACISTFSHRKLAELGLSVPEVMAVVSNENAMAAGRLCRYGA